MAFLVRLLLQTSARRPLLPLNTHLSTLCQVNAWIYDRDPFQPIQWEDALSSFKSRLASGEDVFGPLIRKYILNNKHRWTS